MRVTPARPNHARAGGGRADRRRSGDRGRERGTVHGDSAADKGRRDTDPFVVRDCVHSGSG